jgi:uncharacterized membrane protein YgcG
LNNPVEIIVRSRNRLARLAVIRTLLHGALPLAVTLVIALDLNVLNTLAFDHFGYIMEAAPAQIFQRSVLGLTLFQFVALAIIAWRAASHTRNLMYTAARIDRCVEGRQEIVTLTALFDPANPDAAKGRSSLFPMLWERVSDYLKAFDPRAAFRLDFREPLVRSLLMAALAIIFLSSAAFALMTRPTPIQSVVHRLQLLADTIDKPSASAAQRQMAAAARDVAKDLVNSKLPPQQKLAELTALEHELEKFQKQRQNARAGKGNSSGGGNGNGGGAQAGDRSSGSGMSQNGNGAANHGKANQQMVELRNDIADAQMKLEQDADSGKKSAAPRNDSSNGSRAAPKPGTNPNQPSGQNSKSGSGQVPQPQSLANSKMPPGQSLGAHQTDRGSMGDTHLGEFPEARNYQRFYQLGERGPRINVRDARYVTFQLPTAVESAGTGPMIADNTRPQATTPYTNAPLKEERLPALPDEQQLVPPRYRDLIR